MASFIWASYLTHFFWPFFSQEITVKMEDLYIVNSLAFSVSCGATCLCCKLKAQQQRLHVPDFLWMAPTGNVQPEVSRGGEMSGTCFGFLVTFFKVWCLFRVNVCFHHRKSNPTDSDLVTKKRLSACFIRFYCQGVNVCLDPAHISFIHYTWPGSNFNSSQKSYIKGGLSFSLSLSLYILYIYIHTHTHIHTLKLEEILRMSK